MWEQPLATGAVGSALTALSVGFRSGESRGTDSRRAPDAAGAPKFFVAGKFGGRKFLGCYTSEEPR